MKSATPKRSVTIRAMALFALTAAYTSSTAPAGPEVSTSGAQPNIPTADVLAYGATGDGIADDTEAIQAALDAMQATSEGVVHLPTGPTTFRSAPNVGAVNVLDYGATGDGITSDSVATHIAIDAATCSGGTVYFPPGIYLLDASDTVPDNVYLLFDQGAKLSIAPGITVQLATTGQIIAAPRQHIFNLIGSGTIQFTGVPGINAHAGTVYPQWWGAKGDYSTDDTDAIQAALDCAPDPSNAALSEGVTVYFPRGCYMFSNIYIPGRTVLQGTAQFGGSSLIRIAGSAGTAVEDKGHAIAIHIRNLELNCNYCTGDGIQLGITDNAYSPGGANVWGWNGIIDRVRVANAVGRGIHVNTNGNSLRNIQVTHCQGSIVGGIATKIVTWHDCSSDLTNPERPTTTPFGLKLTGYNMALHGFHGEGWYGMAAVDVDAVCSTLSGIECTVGANRTLPAVIQIEENRDSVSIFGVSAYAYEGHPDNGEIIHLIIDEAYNPPHGTRCVTGRPGSAAPTRIKYWDEYHVGRQRNALLRDPYPVREGRWLRGDYLRVEAASGYPSEFVCLAPGSPGTWGPTGSCPGAISKTSDYTVTTDDNGKRFSNARAEEGVDFALPPGAFNLEYEFIKIADQRVTITPNSAEQIHNAGAGVAFALANVGDCVRLGYGGHGKWHAIRSNVRPRTGQTYVISNATTDRAFDADHTNTEELAKVLATLILDLQTTGILHVEKATASPPGTQK
ncbi:MAG: hypothetical protein JW741_08040 [Sedimentisphaerales bacterium]|nr:hypothetical protein [Sedimentisphaerales bacterium]